MTHKSPRECFHCGKQHDNFGNICDNCNLTIIGKDFSNLLNQYDELKAENARLRELAGKLAEALNKYAWHSEEKLLKEYEEAKGK